MVKITALEMPWLKLVRKSKNKLKAGSGMVDKFRLETKKFNSDLKKKKKWKNTIFGGQKWRK